ncbi:BrnT family toxin [Cypionkella sp.]|uniref:BrnT family toxin n=1 Tax=Cypionkella sp. TaxID=2811411 RepID=UPI002625F2D6|nr:BrnT family toxin [Cypionkella sp.]
MPYSHTTFEFDPAKSATNLAKHGIDFDVAQALWQDERLLQVAAKTKDEARFFAIGRIGEKCWTAICTQRGEAVRIISVRRARKEEMGYYEST